ncbi:MAG: hypothetical protein AAF916_04685 [Planctomycetota bacterium]
MKKTKKKAPAVPEDYHAFRQLWDEAMDGYISLMCTALNLGTDKEAKQKAYRLFQSRIAAYLQDTDFSTCEFDEDWPIEKKLARAIDVCRKMTPDAEWFKKMNPRARNPRLRLPNPDWLRGSLRRYYQRGEYEVRNDAEDTYLYITIRAINHTEKAARGLPDSAPEVPWRDMFLRRILER